MRSAFVMLVMLVMLVGGPAAGDPRPMSAGATPAPLGSTRIRIAREDLAIELDRQAAAVRALLLLENLGPATRLVVGFPCDRSLDPGIAGLECKTRLAVKVDGQKQAISRKRSHWVWPMSFTAGQRREVEVTYRAPLRNDRYERPYNGMAALHYRLVTGAEWAGPIGELRMRVTMPTDAIIHITPAGYTRERGRISWDLRDHEPATDVAIFFHPRFLNRKDATPEERRALAQDLRAELGEMRDWMKILHRVTREAIVAPAPTDEELAAVVEASARLYEAQP
jgi:hypothetical protein